MGARVLVVDDDPWILRMVTATLQKKDFVVDTAREGRQALERAQANPPDVIISDVMMPVMDGWTFVQRLRGIPRLASIPVIFLTALGKDEAKLRSLGMGPDDFLPKPFRFEELEKRVAAALRASEPAAAPPTGPGVPGSAPTLDPRTAHPGQIPQGPTHQSGLLPLPGYPPGYPYGPGYPPQPGQPQGVPPGQPQQGARGPYGPPPGYPPGFAPPYAAPNYPGAYPNQQQPPHQQQPQHQQHQHPQHQQQPPQQQPPQPQQQPPQQQPPQQQQQPGQFSPYAAQPIATGAQTGLRPPAAAVEPAAHQPPSGPAEVRLPPIPAGTPGTRRTTALNGRIEQLGLSSLLVMMEMERKDGVLSLRDSDTAMVGRIFLRRGQVISAKLDERPDSNGRECVYAMLAWQAGTFSFSATKVDMEDTIESSTTHLLMEGARRIDESARDGGGGGDDGGDFL